MIIDSLLAKLGFVVDPSGAHEFETQMGDIRDSVLKLGGVLTGAAAGIGLFVQHVAEGMAQIHDFAELNEMSAKSVAALGKIAVENDSSLEGMKSSLQGLNKVIGEAALGVGRGAMTFQKLGLHAKDSTGKVKSADEMLGEIAGKMEGLSRQEQIALAEKLGIDPQLVKLLSKGADNLARLREEAEAMSPFTDRDYAIAEEIDKLFIKAKGTLGVFSKQIAVELMPRVRDALKGYLDWFKAARKATSGEFGSALKTFSSIVGRLYDQIVRLVGKLYEMGKVLLMNKTAAYLAAGALALFASVKTYNGVIAIIKAVRGLAAGIMAVNGAALILPAIIGAIILAVGLLIDDFMAFKEGGDSLIGDLVKKFPVLGDVIKAIEEVVSTVFGFMAEAFAGTGDAAGELLGALWDLVKMVVGTLWPMVKMVFEGWGYILGAIAPIVLKVLALVVGGIAKVLGWILQIAAKIVEGITWLFGWIVTGFGAVLSALFDGAMLLAKGVIAAFRLLADGVVAVAGFIGSAFSALWDGVKVAAGIALDVIKAGFGLLSDAISAHIAFIKGAWGILTDVLTGNFKGAADRIVAIWDRAIALILGGVEKAKAAVNWVSEKLGFGSVFEVKAKPAAQPEVGQQPAQAAGNGQAQQGGQQKPGAAPVVNVAPAAGAAPVVNVAGQKPAPVGPVKVMPPAVNVSAQVDRAAMAPVAPRPVVVQAVQQAPVVQQMRQQAAPQGQGQAAATPDRQAAPVLQFQQKGALGKAADASNSTSTSNTNVNINAPITVNSTDPAKAGESVVSELNRVNKRATRNGESAVAL